MKADLGIVSRPDRNVPALGVILGDFETCSPRGSHSPTPTGLNGAGVEPAEPSSTEHSVAGIQKENPATSLAGIVVAGLKLGGEQISKCN